MGLRFRKTISILPGVKLNLGKSSASVSVGVPGFRKTFNTKGTVTTTVGLPGTGLYYVDAKNPRKEKEKAKKKAEREQQKAAKAAAQPRENVQAAPIREEAPRRQPYVPQIERRSLVGRSSSVAQVNRDSLLSIHKTADDTIIWAEVARSPEAPDASYNQEMWSYYHSVAQDILGGDIDAYLRLIYEVNPLDDLLEYGSGFTFGTDDPARMEVEFTVNTDALLGVKATVRQAEYNAILQDFICSTAIRIARDMFALLPLDYTIVHAQLREETVLSVCFDRASMETMRFGFIDPGDTMARYPHNMNFSEATGFAPVERLQ